MNLERLDGMVFLWDHGCDPKIGRRPLGKVLDWKLDGDRSIASIRWSNKDWVKEFRQDVAEGVLTNISFGYQIDDYRVVPGDDDDTVVITRWTPVEISLVSVPADHTVGVGRSWEPDLKPPEPEPVEEKVTAQTETREAPPYKSTIETNNEPIGEAMGTENNEEKVIQFDVEAERAKLRQQESDRIRGIAALCKKHNLASLGDELIEKGTSIEEARSIVLDKIERNYNPVPVGAPLDDANISGFGERENRQYSLLRAYRSCIPGTPEYKENCFEKEVSQEIARKTGKADGLNIPYRNLSLLETRSTINTSTPASGGVLVQDTVMGTQFIDLLRNKSSVLSSGATFLPGLIGKYTMPGQASGVTTYWLSENEGIPPGSITFRGVTLDMRTIAARIPVTRNMVMQTDISVENKARQDLAAEIALGLDRAALYGSGGKEPLGILNTPGIGTISGGLGTDGGPITWQALVQLWKAIKVGNGDTGTMGWIMPSAVAAELMITPMQSSGVEGNYILKPDTERLIMFPFQVTEQMPANYTKGNGTDLGSILLGVWSEFVIGNWGNLSIDINPYGEAWATGGMELRAMQSADCAVRHPESFAALTDITTT